jgi:formylglycine-generating enzyme required for sulfatase activity
MKRILFVLTLILSSSLTHANDVVVTGVSLSGQTTSGPLNTHFVNVQFSINWKNSWRTSTNESNYDGCWIFVKYRKQSTSVWLHATLHTSGQTAPAGSVVQPASDGKGAFVYRSANGYGDVNFNNAAVRWNYGADGVLDNENVEVVVYAVEMVYIPQSPFNLGNASAETNKFRDGNADTWFPVTSENAIDCGAAAGQLYAVGNFTNSGTIPAEYPKGYNAFWILKYEFSKQQYVDFLNTLDQTTANLRNNIGATGSVPNMAVTEPERAVNGLSVVSMLAWLDWAALRPMTEFEYEKACRGGNNTPSPLEFAWGNTTITTISAGQNVGTATETWTNGNANLFSGGPGVPMRCGALADATSDRTQSGGSFYGVMELSGNVGELCVYAGDPGRSFTGNHGDGKLNAVGESNETGWPSELNDYTMMVRGGSYQDASNGFLQVSSRAGFPVLSVAAYANQGGRGVRTAE